MHNSDDLVAQNRACKLATPRLEINLAQIEHNTKTLISQLAVLGVSVTGVTKGVLGCPQIARAMLRGGVSSIGDSRLENIQRMRNAGITAQFVLLRSPQLSRVDEVVSNVDISLNSELSVIIGLSQAATRLQKKHKIILMVELGDLREGILPTDLATVFEQCLKLSNLEVIGIGTNLSCLSGVKTDDKNMRLLASASREIERKFQLTLPIISGGNSATINWLYANPSVAPINHVRIGEALLLGTETLARTPIQGFHQQAITLVAEVIESKVKPSIPEGSIGENAFGRIPTFSQRGEIQRSILNIGQQDVSTNDIQSCHKHLQIIGASSDHLVLDSTRHPLLVGDEVKFNLNYGSLLTLMTSPFVKKAFL